MSRIQTKRPVKMERFRRFFASVSPGKTHSRRISVHERFAYFRAIGAANDAFLHQLAGLQERLNSPGFIASELVAVEAESLLAHVRSMVESLIGMSGGRYGDLLEHFETLHRALSRQAPNKSPIEHGPTIVWPTDPASLQPEIVGPKAARLAEVALKTKLRVPPFFSISAHAYRGFMKATGLQDTVHRLFESLDPEDASSIRKFSELVSRAFAEAPFPPELEAELSAGFRKLLAPHPDITGVAVRSSAVVEDAESSFAGQFESILNVPESELTRAYKEVVASKYRYDALKYSLNRGHFHDDIAMPVLVMIMLKPSASGVAYSRCPHRPNSSMVTAVPGLAHAADSGRVIPDTYFVSPEDPAHVETLAGKWDYSLRCAVAGGLIERNEGGSSRTSALRDGEVRRVAHAACELERYFDFAQDVEWALEDMGELSIVQTRPLYHNHR